MPSLVFTRTEILNESSETVEKATTLVPALVQSVKSVTDSLIRELRALPQAARLKKVQEIAEAPQSEVFISLKEDTLHNLEGLTKEVIQYMESECVIDGLSNQQLRCCAAAMVLPEICKDYTLKGRQVSCI